MGNTGRREVRQHGGLYPSRNVFVKGMFDVGLFVQIRFCISPLDEYYSAKQG